MRILVASGTWYPERNGVARVATEVASKLAERGHEVTALVPRVADLPTLEANGSLAVLRVIERNWLPLTVKDVLETSRNLRGLGAGPFDVLLAHSSMTAVGLLRAPLQRPLVYAYYAPHGRELRFMRSRVRWGRERLVAYLNEPAVLLLERLAVRRSTRIMILSSYSRSQVVADHPRQSSKIRAVSGGVDTRSFSPADGMHAARGRLGLDPGSRLLVTVRRAEPRMGLEQLIRAVTLLKDLAVELAIVGGGLLTDELRRLASALKVEERVRLVGHVAEDELRDWYRAADLFVLPTVAYEGFGMVTVEALASGTPVVGTPVGATPELLEPLDRRLVSEGTSAASLATAVRRALGFVDETFRTRCRDYAETRFDWNVVVRGWEAALTEAALSYESISSIRP